MNKVERVGVKKDMPLKKIIIFGSYVPGEVDEYSGLDFVVIKERLKNTLSIRF